MNKKHILTTLCVGVAIGLLLGAYVQAQVSTVTTISSGLLLEPNYLIYRESSTYYAKNMYGAIDYYGTNATEVINSAITALPSSPYNKGKISFADSVFELNGSILVKNGVDLEGVGLGSELHANGDYPVIFLDGTGYINIRYLNIRGYSNSSTSSFGLHIEMGNKISVSYVWFSRCRVAIYVNGSFQTYFDHIRIGHDTVIDQSYNGIESVYNSARINEITVSDSLILDVENVGVQLRGGNGALFESVSVINSGAEGWVIGDETTGGSSYLHFVQCYADSPTYTASAGWIIMQGSGGDQPHTIQMVNIWVGGYRFGMIIEEAHDVTLLNFYAKDIDRNALALKGSNRTTVVGGEIWDWDRADSGVYSGTYVYSGAVDNLIDGLTYYNTNTGAYSIYVSGATRTQISDVNTYNAENIVDAGTTTRVTSSWNSTNWISTYP